MEEKRILITGGSGLLGNALKKKLENFVILFNEKPEKSIAYLIEQF